MLTQERADELLAMPKRLLSRAPIKFPLAGEIEQLKVKAEDEREPFIIDVNRKGTVRLLKCTYQERYAVIEILLRLDVGGPPHENPDGEEVPTPHLHIYREGYGDKWAYPIPAEFTDPNDLVKTLRDFLKYCNIQEIPEIQRGVV